MDCKYLILTIAIVACLGDVFAQIPPRLQIPGAIPLGAFPVPERVQPPVGVHRVRRPQQIKSAPIPVANNFPVPQAQQQHEAKPVNEEHEDESYQPSFIPPNFQQQQQLLNQPQQQQQQLNNEQHLTESVRQLPIPQQQQQQQQQHHQRPVAEQAAAARFAFGGERQHQQQPQQQQVRQQNQNIRRPAFREASPAYESEPAAPRRAIIQSQHDNNRPRNSQEHQQNQERDQKPVAQILRKYREENEDGSITWGFENDDGSYKEEFIGIDCVTRGRYGYVDPDGMKREYTYETGIACDPNKRDSQEDEVAEGYVDYQTQEMVLPNGDRFDIAGGKNKGRRPPPNYPRN